jgi:hypothetical protein
MVFHIRRNGGQALSIAETCQVESINFETAIVGGYVT